jgi:hypothetical protein
MISLLILMIIAWFLWGLFQDDHPWYMLGLICFLAFSLYTIFTVVPSTIWSKRQDIVSLDYSDSISGPFFLGSGSISGERLYYAYTKEGNLYKLISLNAERTYLEESDETPSVWDFGCNEDSLRMAWFMDICQGEKTVLKIPKNSIIKDFKPN